MSATIDKRTCRVCHRALPLDAFYASGHGNSRRRPCIRCCHEQEAAKRNARNASTRHQRYDGHGNVWCNNCRQYRPADDFRPHPSRPGKYWSYCKPCTRELDRLRWRGERKERANARGPVLKRRRRQRGQRERTAFVKNAILTLRRRGLTKSEVAKLADVSLGSLLIWERGERNVTPAVGDRFMILLRETRQLELADEPVKGRRLSHPALPYLLARCRPQMAQHPVRSRWKDKDERRAAA